MLNCWFFIKVFRISYFSLHKLSILFLQILNKIELFFITLYSHSSHPFYLVHSDDTFNTLSHFLLNLNVIGLWNFKVSAHFNTLLFSQVHEIFGHTVAFICIFTYCCCLIINKRVKCTWLIIETVLMHLWIFYAMFLLNRFQMHFEHSLQRSLTFMCEHALKYRLITDTIRIMTVTKLQIGNRIMRALLAKYLN